MEAALRGGFFHSGSIAATRFIACKLVTDVLPRHAKVHSIAAQQTRSKLRLITRDLRTLQLSKLVSRCQPLESLE